MLARSFLFLTSIGISFTLNAQVTKPLAKPALVPAAEVADAGCQEIDLNASPQSPLRMIPMYDQGETGLCYAYAAAQMIDFVRLKSGDMRSGYTHPTYAAWVYKYKSDAPAKEDELGMGSVYSVINTMRSQGSCAYGEVDARLSVLTKPAGHMSSTELVAFLDQVKSESDESTFRRNLRQIVSEPLCLEERKLIQELRRYNLYGVAAPSVLEPLFRNCRRVEVNVPPVVFQKNTNDQGISSALNKNLELGLPATISYCAGILSNSRSRDTVRILNGSARLPSSRCERHASLVTAQASFGGQCHYLIRNAYGNQYRDSAVSRCACITTSGKYEKVCTQKKPREIVGCWHSQETVLANTYGLTSFQ